MNSSEGNSSNSEKPTKKPLVVTIVITLLALTSPILIQGWYIDIAYSISFASFLYGWGVTETSVWYQFAPISFLPMVLILILPRISAPIQMYRYYNGESSRQNTLLVALFSESTGFLMIFPMLFSGFSFTSILIPTPLILIVCGLLLWLSPMPAIVQPWEETNKS